MVILLVKMVRFVRGVGNLLIGYQIRNVSNVVIRFLRIWIWDRTQCVRIVRVANAIWILYDLGVFMMMFRKI